MKSTMKIPPRPATPAPAQRPADVLMLAGAGIKIKAEL
jgi:hypothetical protein